MSVGQIIYDYQTLIGSGVAIGAALLAAWPVWRQLRQNRIQTAAITRDFLQDRINATDSQRKWCGDHLRPFLDEMNRKLFELDAGDKVHPEWAFHNAQKAWQLLNGLRTYRDSQSDSPTLDDGLGGVIAAMETLEKKLDAIHRPHSMDRDDPEQSMTDEDWSQLESDAEESERSLPEAVSMTEDVLKRLDDALARELTKFRTRVRQTDATLSKG